MAWRLSGVGPPMSAAHWAQVPSHQDSVPLKVMAW
jgi:hypothetical protein